jgi:hypothetical protein
MNVIGRGLHGSPNTMILGSLGLRWLLVVTELRSVGNPVDKTCKALVTWNLTSILLVAHRFAAALLLLLMHAPSRRLRLWPGQPWIPWMGPWTGSNSTSTASLQPGAYHVLSQASRAGLLRGRCSSSQHNRAGFGSRVTARRGWQD